MSAEGVGWEEIADARLDGAYSAQELFEVANLAHRCLQPLSKRRPARRDIVQSLSSIVNSRHFRRRQIGRPPVAGPTLSRQSSTALFAPSLTPE